MRRELPMHINQTYVEKKQNENALPMSIVIDEDFPDPSVFYDTKTKQYYAHATHDRHNLKDSQKIKAAFSPDLLNWTVVSEDALVEKPEWSIDNDFWAPFTVYDDKKGIYRMYYATRVNKPHRAREGDAGEDAIFGISVAESAHPLTGFKDVSHAPIVQGSDGCIDPFVYKKNEKWMLVWGSNGYPIREQELTEDGKYFSDPLAKPTVLLDIIENHPDERLVEGAYIDSYKGHTYLWYSGADAFGNGSTRRGISKYGDYSIMVARLNSKTGKYERPTEVIGIKDNIVLEGNEYFKNPGNNSIVHVGDRTFLFCHAIDRRNPYFDNITRFNRRPMTIAEVIYKDGWPQVVGGRFEKGEENIAG